MNIIQQLRKPNLDAPLQSWTPLLIAEGVNGHPYNIVGYGDFFWGAHWVEGSFDVPRFLDGGADAPIILGSSAEEVARGLDLMFPEKQPGIHPPQNVEAYFDEDCRNLFSFKPSVRESALIDLPNNRNRRLKHCDLFKPGDGLPITLISPAPHRTCNYRCEYCYHNDYGFKKVEKAFAAWEKAILRAVERIPRPLLLSMGVMGEPLYTPEWWDVVYQILKRDHVQRIAFVSNLSLEIAPFLEDVDGERIGVAASLHPSEFKNLELNLSFFLGQVAFLKEIGASVVVNYVLTPEQIPEYPRYRTMVNDLGVPMTCNILRGSYRGKMFPEAYSEDEFEIIREYHEEIPFIFDYQSHKKNPYGGRCTSGRYVFHMEMDGSLYNCHFARQRMGSVFDDELIVRAENGYCTSFKCECKSTISLREDVVCYYRSQGNMHHFDRRADGEKGLHPFL